MIRTLTGQDAARCADIHAASFHQGWSEDTFNGHIQKDIALGLGDPVNGFILIRTALDQAEILTIAVDPEQRRTGLGHRLLSAGEHAAAQVGVNMLFLEVAEDNPAAIALYRRADYEEIGKRPAYYRRENGRVAALTFRKRLDAAP